MRLPILALFCGLAACPPPEDDDTVEGDADADTDSDTDVSGLRGRIAVLEVDDQGHEEEYGAFAAWGPLDVPWEDGIVGEWVISCGDQTGDTGVWRVIASEGACDLAVLSPCGGDCDGGCPYDTYCTADGACAPEPVFADAGTLDIGGLSKPLTVEPAAGRYLLHEALPAELFDPGDPVDLAASGGAIAAFTASTTGVGPLDVALPCETVPTAGQDLTLAWTPSGDPAARIRWDMVQDVHLAQGPRLRCEVADTGSLTVPAALVGQYLYGQKHALTLTRFTAAQIALDGGGTLAFEVGAASTCTINEHHTPW
jgi:hypothetical protein